MQSALYLQAKDAAVALTEQMIKTIEKCQRSQFNLAISGGRTPETLFSLWSHEYREKIPWEKIHFYWVDERCVPFSSPDSNYGMAKHLLFDLLPIPTDHIYPIMGALEPDHETDRYNRLVHMSLAVYGDKPNFDLILLGVGADGHTSSIFPEDHLMLTSRKYYQIANQPMSGKKRIALTAHPIIECEQVFFFVTGREKQGIIERMIDASKEDQNLYPAVYIAAHNHASKLFYAYHE